MVCGMFCIYPDMGVRCGVFCILPDRVCSRLYPGL